MQSKRGEQWLNEEARQSRQNHWDYFEPPRPTKQEQKDSARRAGGSHPNRGRALSGWVPEEVRELRIPISGRADIPRVPTVIEQNFFVMMMEHRMEALQGYFHSNPDYAT